MPTPEQNLEEQEKSQQLREAIQSLSPNYRAVVEYRHFQDLSYDQIAEAMDRPVSSVKSDLFRARKLLATKLKEMKHLEGGKYETWLGIEESYHNIDF